MHNVCFIYIKIRLLNLTVVNHALDENGAYSKKPENIVAKSIQIFVLILRFLPESPRWLYGAGKKEEACKLLVKAAKYNGKEISSKLFGDVDLGPKQTGKIWMLFSDRRLGVRTVIIFYNW